MCDFHRIGNGVKVPHLTCLLDKNQEIHSVEYVSYIDGNNGAARQRVVYDIFYTCTGVIIKRHMLYNMVVIHKQGNMYRDIDDIHMETVGVACDW